MGRGLKLAVTFAASWDTGRNSFNYCTSLLGFLSVIKKSCKAKRFVSLEGS